MRRNDHPSLVRGRTRIGTRAKITWKPMNIGLRTATVGMSRGSIVFDGPPQLLEEAHLLEIYGGEGWLD